MDKSEYVDITVCNPPFHKSKKDAEEGSLRKESNLKRKKVQKATLNFSGQNNELWTDGGEERFVKNVIKESKKFSENCFWFTSLIAKSKHLKPLEECLQKLEAVEVKVVPMGQGNKSSRMLAWTFLTKEKQLDWKKRRWKNTES